MSAIRGSITNAQAEAAKRGMNISYGSRGPAEGEFDVRWMNHLSSYRALLTFRSQTYSGYGPTVEEAREHAVEIAAELRRLEVRQVWEEISEVAHA